MSYMVMCEILIPLDDGSIDTEVVPYTGDNLSHEEAEEELKLAKENPAVMGRAWIVEVEE